MHLEHFIAATLPFSRPNETNFDFEKVRRGMVVMHGRDLARESMMNNDGGAMEERWLRLTKVSVYFQASVKSAVITLIIAETRR